MCGRDDTEDFEDVVKPSPAEDLRAKIGDVLQTGHPFLSSLIRPLQTPSADYFYLKAIAEFLSDADCAAVVVKDDESRSAMCAFLGSTEVDSAAAELSAAVERRISDAGFIEKLVSPAYFSRLEALSAALERQKKVGADFVVVSPFKK